jgi:predicted HAD superfamily phosphohydrolase YqeG
VGAHSILVRPISDDSMPHTKIARLLERRVLKQFNISW